MKTKNMKITNIKKIGELVLIFIVFIWIFVGSIGIGSAFGITPGKTTINFLPGLNKTIAIDILNLESKNISIEISVRGELGRYIVPKEISFEMGSNEGIKQVIFNLSLPNELKPGINSGEIYVSQVPKKIGGGESYIGAILAFVSKIDVVVPYPGKYIEADLNIVGASEGGEVTFIIPVVNKGESNLQNVYANFEIYNKKKERVASFSSDGVEIANGERKEIIKKWRANVPFGTYNVVATIVYGGEPIKLEKEFDIGAEILELQEIKVKDFVFGGIAVFEMVVENKWNEKIKDAYAKIELYNKDGVKIADFKSLTNDIGALSRGVFYSYWDSSGIDTGIYDAIIYLNYGTKTIRKDVKFNIKKDGIEIVGISKGVYAKKKDNGLMILMVVLITLIIILIIINLSWILRKRHKKRMGKYGI
ncbi:MAG: hypothetical protein N3D20_02990 [Candidatus Pacearchaeota archaeon]|nr:hypothetical protein [Candidatus Pacearchaeota archaeon]